MEWVAKCDIIFTSEKPLKSRSTVEFQLFLDFNDNHLIMVSYDFATLSFFQFS